MKIESLREKIIDYLFLFDPYERLYCLLVVGRDLFREIGKDNIEVLDNMMRLECKGYVHISPYVDGLYIVSKKTNEKIKIEWRCDGEYVK